MDSPSRPPGASAEFSTVAALLALIVDPQAARSRLDQLEARGAELEKAADRLKIERAAFVAETEKARAELAEQTKAIANRRAELLEAERAREAQEARIKAYAERVGYVERPATVVIGGLTYASIPDEEPQPDPHFPAQPRISDERFGESNLRVAADETPPPVARRTSLRRTATL